MSLHCPILNSMNETEKSKVFIVIPAFNEGSVIGDVINGIKNAGYENILVINDGSRDNTEHAARNAGAEVLSHIINRGQGAALRTGIEYLKENHDPEVIVTFDADGQHQAEDIQRIVKPVLEENFDIALGSRFLEIENEVPAFRKILLKAGIVFTYFVSGIKLTDAHNGFRALGKKAIDSIQISQRGMTHASEIVEEIQAKNLRHKEIPVKILYTAYSKAKGQHASNSFKIASKILLRKITG